MDENELIGVHFDMPNADYHASPGLGSSGFKLLQQSPLHFWNRCPLNPDRTPDKTTPAKRRGTAWHCALFEPDAFDDRYITLPEGLDRRTKEGKALWSEIEASGKSPIKPDEYEKFMVMAKAARAHKVSRVLFEQHKTIAEASIFVRDERTGILLRIRPDIMIEPCDTFPNGFILDGKSTPDASPQGFGRFIWNYASFYQAAFYSDVFQQHYKTKEPPPFVWCVQEADAPYATAYYGATPTLLSYGRKMYRKLIDLYVDCLRRNEWPGYAQKIVDASLPGWAEKEIDGALSD